MGRAKIDKEKKATNLSISFSTDHLDMLDYLTLHLSLGKSQVIQQALETFYQSSKTKKGKKLHGADSFNAK
jgi:hypothetical protein